MSETVSVSQPKQPEGGKQAKSNEPLFRFPDLQHKTEDFLNKHLFPILKNYPKTEKYAAQQEARQTAYRLVREITLANNARNSKKATSHLLNADDEKIFLFVLLNSAYSQRYLSAGQLRLLQSLLADIGALIGGSLKSLDSK